MHTHVKKMSAVLCAGLAGALMVAMPSHAGGTLKNKYGSGTQTYTCSGGSGGHTLTYAGPTTMWPPNHKTVTVTVTAAGHQDDDVMLMTSVANSDVTDGVEKVGSGNPHLENNSAPQSDSASTSNTHSIFLRSERSGTSPNGRTYTITATAHFNDAPTDTCTTSWDVTVPHDMGN
jgi:hypothetical protein